MKKGPCWLTLTGGLGLAAVLLLVFMTPVASSSPPSRGPDSFEIGLQSRQFTPEPGISPGVRVALEGRGEEALAQGAAQVHTILQLDYIPTPEQKEQLRQQGIELLTYIPNYAWLAAVPATNPAQVAGVPGVRWVGNLTVQDKLQPELQAQEWGPWAYDPASDFVVLLVQFYKDIDLTQGKAVVEAHGGAVVGEVDTINTLVVHVNRDEVAALAAEDAVEWIEQPLPLLEPINDGNRARVGANTLQAAPYNLDGTNVDVLVYDAGRVYSHSDLNSKRTWGDATSFSDHATHVACTVLGAGIVNYTYRGMAPQAELLSMGFEYDGTGVFLYTNPGDIQDDLNYAKNTWSPSADLFNASLGTNTVFNGFPCSFEGNYGATSQLLDAVVRGSLGEPFIAAWANGNERGGDGRCGTTYHTTAPPACAKNPIHAGATDSTDDSMSYFSSWGPCDDGRLKPTISAPGVDVMSCNDSNGYVNMGGTSMASPTTAGVIALMLEQYRTTYSTSGEFLPSTAKALLIHTAIDLGNAGPDYRFGYGRIDGKAAVDAIIARNFRQETITTQGQIDEYTVTVSGSPAQLKASLAWDDPAGSLAAIKKLVNDLDLELRAPNGTIYYPWVLDPGNPGNPAATGVDDINNQEQVVVTSPTNGTWRVRVKGTTVPEAPQEYSLVFPGAGAASKNTTPGGGPPDPPPTSCSQALTNRGFESGPSPWVWSGSATRSSTDAHSGMYSGRVGGTSDGYFHQEVTLPSDFYSGTLTYWVRMDTSEWLHPYDYFDAEIRDGSDDILTTLQTLTDGDLSYEGTWRRETFTLGPEYAGRTIRLRFGADVDTWMNTYWYVDDVSLNACLATGGTPPDIEVSPTSFEETVYESEMVTQTLTISNTGALSLDFSIQEQEGPTTDVPWLSEDPISGTVLAGNSLPVDVTLDATGLVQGNYTASLIINSNDPDEDPVTVPVVLHVWAEGVGTKSYLPIILKNYSDSGGPLPP